MKTPTTEKFLTRLGLSPKEVQVYLYCLKQGPQLMTILAKAINVTRANIYDVAKKLEKRGLCYMVGTSHGKRLKSIEPEDIQALLDAKESEIDDMRQELTDLLPAFKAETKATPSSFTNVSYHEGADNLRKLIWKSLQSKSGIVRIAGSELDIASSLGKSFLVDYHTRRAAKKTKLKAIRPDSKRLPGEVFNNDKQYLRDIRKRPKGKIRMKSNIIIWDTYIALYSVKNEAIFGTLIENESMAIMIETWFDLIWENSSKI